MYPVPRFFLGRAAFLSRVLLTLGVLSLNVARADHYSGASITYACQTGNQYKIYLDLYLDCAGTPLTPQSLYFSNACGVVFTLNNLVPVSTTEVSPLCPSQLANSTCSGGALPSFRRHRFEVTLFLSPCAIGPWKVEWFLCCRNTMVNLANVPGIYAQATVQHEAGVCDASPVFVDSGIPYVCVGEPVSYNPGVSDPNGNNMVFSLIDARFGAPAPTPVSYAAGFTGASPFPGITIQPTTGQLNFTPTVTGNYVVVIEVATYDVNGVLIGRVMRDLMFVVIICDENPPASSNITNQTPGLEIGPNSIGVCNGQSFCAEVIFTDPNPTSVITVTSNALTLLPGATFTVTGTNPAAARICWVGNLAALPVNVFIQGNDGACPIPNINSRSILVGDCLSPLPITLIEFRARSRPEDVLLEWVTATETDNKEFIIERSADGILFLPIGSVPGSGYSQERLDYAWPDRDPLPMAAYYRLRQTDADGSSTLSDVVVAGRTKGGPSPMVTKLTDGAWWLSLIDGAVTWHIHDLAGRTLAEGVSTEGGGTKLSYPEGYGVQLLTVIGPDGIPVSALLPGGALPGTSILMGSTR